MRVYGFPGLGGLGRLGNQLWQVAATVSKARRNPGSRPYIPPDWEYRPFLRVPEECYAPASRADELVDCRALPGGPFFQQLEHIAEVYTELAEWYSPSEHGAERLLEVHRPLLEQTAARHVTAMHVRRTDYLEHSDRFPQLTRRYRRGAVLAVTRVEPDTEFLVFSDDPAWCAANIEELGLEDQTYRIVAGHVRPVNVYERTTEPADIYDLWLMTRCAAHIIANSTYSWWGAFLSYQRLVLYPDVWYGDPKLFSTMWDAMPRDWIQLPC